MNPELTIRLLSQNFLKLEASLHSLRRSLQKCRDIGIKEIYSFEESEAFDSLSSKFARTSDIYTQKVLRSIFFLLHEGNLSFIDLAHRAEALNIISNADDLLMVRDVRNQISHEYDDSSLNMIYSRIFDLAQSLEADIENAKLFAVKYQWLTP
jgi:hypothetical protein